MSRYKIKSIKECIFDGKIMSFESQPARGDIIRSSPNSLKEYEITKIVHLNSPELPELHIIPK